MFRNVLFTALATMLLAACTQSDGSNPASAESASLSTGASGAGAPGHIFEFLDLTDDQKAQVEAVFASFAQEREAIRSMRRDGATREDLKAAHDQLREKVHAELEKILTAEQRALLAQHHERYGRRGEPLTEEQIANRIDQRVDMLTEALALTTDQQAAVRTLIEEMFAWRQAHQGSRPDEQTREAHRAEFEAAMQEILTPEQFAIFQELHRQHGRRFGPRGDGRG